MIEIGEGFLTQVFLISERVKAITLIFLLSFASDFINAVNPTFYPTIEGSASMVMADVLLKSNSHLVRVYLSNRSVNQNLVL